MNRFALVLVSIVAAAVPACRSKTRTEQVRGTFGKTAYTIELPEGFHKKSMGDDILVYADPNGDYGSPQVILQFEPAIAWHTLDEYVATSVVGRGDGRDIVRKAAIDDGFIVVTRSPAHDAWYISVLRTRSGKGISCGATQHKPGAQLDDSSREMLETMCLSLTLD